MSRELRVYVATSILTSGPWLGTSRKRISDAFDLADLIIAEGKRRFEAETRALGPLPEPGSGTAQKREG